MQLYFTFSLLDYEYKYNKKWICVTQNWCENLDYKNIVILCSCYHLSKHCPNNLLIEHLDAGNGNWFPLFYYFFDFQLC